MPDQEKTVLVVGAGASLAEAQDRRPTRTKEHPPLDATFFQRVAKHRPSTLFNRVEAQARRLGESDLAARDPAVSLESYLGRLYFEVQQNPLKASVRAYFEAVELYAKEIIQTTNWMMGKGGLIKKVIQSEIKAGRSVSIVTFNVDLLIENSLARIATGRPSADWSLDSAYGFQTSPELVEGTGSTFGTPFATSGPASSIVTYKMHGSVNWVFPHRDRYPPADLVSKDRDFYIVTNERLPEPGGMRLRTSTRGRNWYASPLIVPPIYEKHAFIRRHLQEVWDGATASLTAADRVIFWGYSFPRADNHARHFFQGLADKNPALRAPTLVNPDPSAETALWEVLRPDRAEHYRHADELLA